MEDKKNISFELIDIGESVKVKITTPISSTYAIWEIIPKDRMKFDNHQSNELQLVVQQYMATNNSDGFPCDLRKLFEHFITFFNKDNIISKLQRIIEIKDITQENKELIEEFESRLKSFETMVFTTDEISSMFNKRLN